METSSPPPLATNGINYDTAPPELLVAFDSETFHSYLLALLPFVIEAGARPRI
jgi:hypothetical protein